MDFISILSVISNHITASVVVVTTVAAGFYVVYYRHIHPLSKYPGPFWASLTNLWKLKELWGLHLPDTLVRLHQKYGDVVRIGPNQISFQQGGAVPRIYKAGRVLAKTSFYDGFTSFNANLFGTQDEEVHALRRRQMAHAFSLQSIKEMEPHIDKHLLRFRANLNRFAASGERFDLKELIAFFVLDVLGDLAFRCDFDSQVHQDVSQLPPINDHIFLACLLGMVPDFMPFIKAVLPWTPVPWLQGLLKARQALKDLTATCVRRRMEDEKGARKDLITSLINAVDPHTGKKLTELDIQTEAFAFIVAGSHTTSGTLTLLFSHILQNPAVLKKIVAEVDTKLGDVSSPIIPVEGLESKMEYTLACMNENFRMNSVFTMPLERRVTSDAGFEIEGHLIPKGCVVFSLNHVVHHNPDIWGNDHETFAPERFLGDGGRERERFLSPFSMGHRMCIGRNIAFTNMLKLVCTTFKNYGLQMENPEEKIGTISVGISEKEGPLVCRVWRREDV
ncbi:cytochrome P450 [Plectosphaerella plurivora]|uniref:Cytochrome P450 n=1 Tax=Plectosphaerella plurivora TaxID=936078 RepID=A0A9P8VB49_9PEZI|nr:cytochrome P450 [Plectosphaerella plurivora]